MHLRTLRTLPAPAHGLVAFLLGATVLLVSGCGTGFDAQTNKVYQSGVGATERGGQVEILNGLLVDNGDGTATLSAGLINKQESADTITSVTGKSGGKKVDIGLEAPIELAPGPLVNTGTKAQVIARDDALDAGDYVTLVFSFESSTPVDIEVPVVSRTDTYEDVATAPTESASSPSSEPTDGQTEDFPSDENTVEPQG